MTLIKRYPAYSLWLFMILLTLLHGCSTGSGTNTDTGTVTDTEIIKPSNLITETISISQIQLTWTDNSTNENGFIVERSENSEPFVQIATQASDEPLHDYNVVQGVLYSYRVKAYDSNYESDYSNVVSVTIPLNPPEAPDTLTAITTSQSSINLTWRDTSDNEESFVIERKMQGDTFLEITLLEAGSISFSDSELYPSTEYTYRIKAVNGVDSSAWSDPATATTKDLTPDDDYTDISLKSSITDVQPMTGLVLWTTNSDHNNTDSIQLEYSYMKFNSVVSSKGVYNWNSVEEILNTVQARGHQTILRFYYVYPGDPTTVPDYIKNSSGYNETKGTSEGLATWFPDWSHQDLKDFTLEFFSKFAEKYDNDPRLAYLQVGFGLWSEYHIYDGPMTLGGTFPSKAFQETFLFHMGEEFDKLPWNISIDAADDSVSPISGNQNLLDLKFGLFDDSFLHKDHGDYNEDCFNFFNVNERYLNSPMGGELSYYTNYDQQHALDPQGPHGISFEQLSETFHITYMIGNDQPEYQSMDRIKEAGISLGYKFRIVSFKSSSTESKVVVENSGIAPIYFNAYISINGVRAENSLIDLFPGQHKEFLVNSGGSDPLLTIESDRLVNGQQIQFSADL